MLRAMKPELSMNNFLRVICVLAGFCTATAAQAQGWPTRLIKATIPFGAGSAADVVPRLVFERISAELGQPIVIENRAGGGGTVGSALVAKADPDGYSILAQSSALAIRRLFSRARPSIHRPGEWWRAGSGRSRPHGRQPSRPSSGSAREACDRLPDR